MGVPDFLRTDGLPWNANLLATYAYWGHRGTSTSHNLSSGSGGYSDSVHINWNRTARDLPIYHWRVFENMRSAGCRTCDNLIWENRMYCMKSSSTCQNLIRGRLVNRRDDTLDDCWDFSVLQWWNFELLFSIFWWWNGELLFSVFWWWNVELLFPICDGEMVNSFFDDEMGKVGRVKEIFS